MHLIFMKGRCWKEEVVARAHVSGTIPTTRHDYIGFDALVVTGPVPDAGALGAVHDGRLHVQVLQVHLLVRRDDIDIIDSSGGNGQPRKADSWRRAAGRCAPRLGLLLTTTLIKPGSWWVKPLWSWRQTKAVISRLSEATLARQGSSLHFSSHLACWLNIESMTWMNGS